MIEIARFSLSDPWGNAHVLQAYVSKVGSRLVVWKYRTGGGTPLSLGNLSHGTIGRLPDLTPPEDDEGEWVAGVLDAIERSPRKAGDYYLEHSSVYTAA